MGCPVYLLQVEVCASGLVKSHKHQGSNCDGSGHRPRNFATKLPLPSSADIEKFSIPTRNHVSVSCRNLWARVVFSTYAKVKNNPSVGDNWIELFILCQYVLRSTPRGGSKYLRYEENNVQSRVSPNFIPHTCLMLFFALHPVTAIRPSLPFPTLSIFLLVVMLQNPLHPLLCGASLALMK